MKKNYFPSFMVRERMQRSFKPFNIDKYTTMYCIAGPFLPPILSLNCSSISSCDQLGVKGVYCSTAGTCECDTNWILQAGRCIRGG